MNIPTYINITGYRIQKYLVPRYRISNDQHILGNFGSPREFEGQMFQENRYELILK